MSQSQPPAGPMSVAEFKRHLSDVAAQMTVEQLNAVLSRHHGSKAAIARQLGITKTTVSNILADKGMSANVIAAARIMVADLLAVEATWKTE